MSVIGLPLVGPTVRYRSATRSDVDVLTEMTHDRYGSDIDEWRGRLHKALDQEDGCVLLAELDDMVIDYGVLASARAFGSTEIARADSYLREGFAGGVGVLCRPDVPR